jgi:glycosyltransferase involved in cell wall biosynthesis
MSITMPGGTRRGSPGHTAQRVVWLSFAAATSNPMGLQRYEHELERAIEDLDASPWQVTMRRVGGLRSAAPHDARIPLRRLQTASVLEARTLGRLICGRHEHVHRFDLRLPPPPGGGVVTVHDLPPLRFPDEGRLAKWSIRTAADAVLVICPSRFAADEVEHLLGVRRIVVIPNGVDPALFAAPEMASDERSALGLPDRFIMHAGGATERKNLPALAQAWGRVQAALPDHALALLGPPDPRRTAAFRGLPRVVPLGWQPPEMVARLMKSARAVVVPSSYEGFGLPALEGMAAGTAVVAAAAGALPEVCGDAAVLTGIDAISIADGIHAVCTDDDLRASVIGRGLERSREFTWARSARAHLDAYRAAFSGG